MAATSITLHPPSTNNRTMLNSVVTDLESANTNIHIYPNRPGTDVFIDGIQLKPDQMNYVIAGTLEGSKATHAKLSIALESYSSMVDYADMQNPLIHQRPSYPYKDVVDMINSDFQKQKNKTKVTYEHILTGKTFKKLTNKSPLGQYIVRCETAYQMRAGTTSKDWKKKTYKSLKKQAKQSNIQEYDIYLGLLMSVVPVDAQEQKAFRDKMADKAVDKATSIISGKKGGGLFGGGLFGGKKKKKSGGGGLFSTIKKAQNTINKVTEFVPPSQPPIYVFGNELMQMVASGNKKAISSLLQIKKVKKKIDKKKVSVWTQNMNKKAPLDTNETPDPNGYTPLMLAALQGDEAITEMLLSDGAIDIWQQNTSGNDAGTIAFNYSHDKLGEMIYDAQ
jgi:hypothetical protein